MAALDVWTVEVPLRVALFHLDICFRKNLNGWKSYQERKLLLFVIFQLFIFFIGYVTMARGLWWWVFSLLWSLMDNAYDGCWGTWFRKGGLANIEAIRFATLSRLALSGQSRIRGLTRPVVLSFSGRSLSLFLRLYDWMTAIGHLLSLSFDFLKLKLFTSRKFIVLLSCSTLFFQYFFF